MSNGLPPEFFGVGNPFSEIVNAALTTEALAMEPIHSALQQIGPQTTMRYLVECALPETSSVGLTLDAGGIISYQGGLGLAPEWVSGPCTTDCQHWVSACMIARVNRWGMPFIINLTGDHPVLTQPNPNEAQYPFQEGAFFGNYFSNPPEAFACRGKHHEPFTMTIRACTHDPGCRFLRPGSCGPIDGYLGVTNDRWVCEREQDGYYVNCHDGLSDPGGATFPAGSRTFRAITLFVRDAQFGAQDMNGGGC